jgi:hypothetical protein
MGDKIMIAVGCLAFGAFGSMCIVGVLNTMVRVWKSATDPGKQ